MTMSIHYQKRKNTHLFKNVETHKNIQLSSMQNYIPIYNRFFSLNKNNYNSINLNQLWTVREIKENEQDSDNIYTCSLINNLDNSIALQKTGFLKMAPLLDPCKYIVGKYDYTNPDLFQLPSLENEKVHPKMLDINNSSYVDGFFVFLTSLLLNEKKFIHGVDYYGSFLSIKNNFKLDVFDDLDYLVKNDFFIKQQNNLFQIEDYSHLITHDQPFHLTPIKIFKDDALNPKSLSIKSIQEDLFDNIFENQVSISLQDIKENSLELIDVTSGIKNEIEENKTTTLKSGSSCSSRTSHTHSSESDGEDEDDCDECDCEDSNDTMSANDSNENSCENSNDDSEYTDMSDDYEKILVTIPKFPVQVICMEKCDNTFDDLILNSEMKTEEWFSAFMQIIMTLLTYQKVFSFTHNDLHTNNIMYNTTSLKHIYYYYKKKYYKVPTFGKIYKIIDFGRAIYKFDGKTFCSDSFHNSGDASTQYNIEPYFNEKKPRLEPNFSFDLCRLACSIFDYIVEDFDNLKQLQETNPVVKLVVDWCLDDNGINVLYKNNGDERYPDFKLYKMIARHVHNHTPQLQLERSEFKKYVVSKNNIPKDAFILDIDEL